HGQSRAGRAAGARARRAQERGRDRARRLLAPQDRAGRGRHPGPGARAGEPGGAVRGLARALTGLALAACSQDHTLTLHIVTPVGDDPFQQASTVRVSAGSHQSSSPVTGSHFNLSFTFSTGSQSGLAPIVVDALAGNGSIVGHGATPPYPL